MKVLFLADLHCHPFTAFSTINEDGLNSRLAWTLHVFELVYEHCVTNNISTVCILGDVFHTRGKVDTVTYNAVYRQLKMLVDGGISLYIWVGNHDQSNKNGDEHSLEPFKEFATIIDKPQELELDLGLIWACPYTDDPEQLKDWIKTGVQSVIADHENLTACGIETGMHLLAIHTGITGGKVGAIAYQMTEELIVDDLVPEAWDLVLMGHYHKHQWLLPNKVAYVGSPIQHDFGDEGDERGFLVVDSVTKSTQFHSLNDVLPTFHTYEVTCEGDLKNHEPDPLRYTKMVVKTQLVANSQVVAAVSDSAPVIVERFVEKTYETRLQVEENQDVLDAYVSQANTELDKSVLLELGRHIMKEANNGTN